MSFIGPKFFIRINFDKVIGSIVATGGVLVLTEAYFRSELKDAQTSLECRYPPTSSIVTAAHVRELERNNIVVINDVLSSTILTGSRNNVFDLREHLDRGNHSNEKDVRQDEICLVRESDSNLEHKDDIVHCIKLLRGIPHLLNRFGYDSSSSFVVPRQCQLARYLPDGSTYIRHLDKCTHTLGAMGLLGWLRASDYRHRTVTCILYLNTKDWTSGGHLRCFGKQGSFQDVNPKGGTLIIFNSEQVEHKVLPSTKERYALTIFINGIMNEN